MHLIQIPATQDASGNSPLAKLWPQIAPLLERAINHSGGIVSLESELAAIAKQEKQLWVIVSPDKSIIAAGITSIQQYPGGLRAVVIEELGGENMKDWFELKDQFESWAKTEGCTKVRMHARKGWAKHLPDYKLAAYVMEKSIE